MNKLQTCLLFIIALPVIVLIGIPLFLLVFGVSFGFISSLISGIREVLLPLGCIFAAITTIGIISYIITSRKHKKWEMEREERDKKWEMEREEMERDIARFEALSTPEEYVAYYEEKLQELREKLQELREEEQRFKANRMQMSHLFPVDNSYYIRRLINEITDTKKLLNGIKT